MTEFFFILFFFSIKFLMKNTRKFFIRPNSTKNKVNKPKFVILTEDLIRFSKCFSIFCLYFSFLFGI